jgi:hypothetical protein
MNFSLGISSIATWKCSHNTPCLVLLRFVHSRTISSMDDTNNPTNRYIASTRGSRFWSTFKIPPSRASTVPSESGMSRKEALRRSSIQVLSCGTPPDYYQQSISTYNLTWSVLRQWLLKRFKDHPELDQYLSRNQVGGIHYKSVSTTALIIRSKV